MTLDDPVEGYRPRGEYRLAIQRWLAATNLDLLVTLSFPQNIGLQGGRRHLGHWFACLDSHYLGRRWSLRATDQRTMAIAFPENIVSNLHYHCLMRLPDRAQGESMAQRSLVLDRLWIKVAPQGTCH